jgi:hypothetical protein
MALDTSGAGLMNAILIATGASSSFDKTKMQATCAAIVSYFVTNAIITTTVPTAIPVQVVPATGTGTTISSETALGTMS